MITNLIPCPLVCLVCHMTAMAAVSPPIKVAKVKSFRLKTKPSCQGPQMMPVPVVNPNGLPTTLLGKWERGLMLLVPMFSFLFLVCAAIVFLWSR